MTIKKKTAGKEKAAGAKAEGDLRFIFKESESVHADFIQVVQRHDPRRSVSLVLRDFMRLYANDPDLAEQIMVPVVRDEGFTVRVGFRVEKPLRDKFFTAVKKASGDDKNASDAFRRFTRFYIKKPLLAEETLFSANILKKNPRAA